MKLYLKICGMKENPKEVAAFGPDYLGFIFYMDSPRGIERIEDPDQYGDIKKVGVFVNEDLEVVKSRIRENKLDAVQLHGDESSAYCRELRSLNIEIIKVFRVDDDFDFGLLEPFKEVADYYLFDTRSKLYGGSGKRFNWEILKKYDQHKPFFLSGGLDEEALDDLKDLEGMNIYALDLNSGVESAPGHKDPEKIKRFVKKLNEHGYEIYGG